MSTLCLDALIRAAQLDAMPAISPCADHHHWTTDGGRSCQMGADGCSQTVYRCTVCGVIDYGDDDDGPGVTDCKAACGDSMMGWRNGPLDPNPDWLGEPEELKP